MTSTLDRFEREIDCLYEGERYTVRDNGALYRHPRQGKRSRPADGLWTFGKLNLSTGYLELASVRAHRIVATAFHGAPPTRQHVVDHADTNRQNNRPENLRWVTRLENVLLNPITAKRIALLYGSVEAFLANPKMPPVNGAPDKNFEWMRTVSPEEARLSHERLMQWATSESLPSGGKLGDWLFNRMTATPPQPEHPRETQPAFVVSKTIGAVQRNWQVPSHFPACPQPGTIAPLEAYLASLEPGSVFATNDYSKSIVLQAAFSPDRSSLWVMCEFAEPTIKQWALAQVTHEDGLLVHTSEGTFFEFEGAEKYFALGQGLEWTGGEVFDDFC